MSVYAYMLNDEILYIGSTLNLHIRKRQHKSAFKNGMDMPFYNYLREQNIIFENLKLEVASTAITEKEPLFQLERLLIEHWKPICNNNIPCRTRDEWMIDNKDYMKKYRENNKDYYKNYMKEYRKNNKDKIKEYYVSNKDKINEQRKNRYKNLKKNLK
jgi:predicted GIY-YIG superfamily endonuclease